MFFVTISEMVSCNFMPIKNIFAKGGNTMKSNLKGGILGAVVAVAFLLLIGGCSAPLQMASQMPDREITVDANDNEWQNWFYQDEKTNTKVAVCNDSDYVYVCFTTTDTEILTELVRKGFVIWFNSKGNKDRELGINFPFVSQGGTDELGGKPPVGGAPPEGGAPPGGGRDANSVSVADLKILTSKKDKGTIFSVDEAQDMGIFARIRNDQSGKLIYELKMPLKKENNRPYVVKASPENVIGVGLMTYVKGGSRVSGISSFGGSMSDMSSGGMGGGMGGGGGFDSSAAGGGMGGGMGDGRGSGMGGGDMGAGMGGSMDTSQPKVEIWAAVTLAIN